MTAIEEQSDEWWASVPSSVKWIVILAVLGGAGGNVNTFVKTDDRFRGADFHREIAERDARIASLEQQLRIERDKLQRHLEHSARYSEKIDHIEDSLRRAP